MTRKAKRRPFGQVTRMRSGRYQARYTGPDGKLHTAGHTFDAEIDAAAWLKAERALLDAGSWTPPQHRNAYQPGRTLGSYAAGWLAARTLKPRTREHYQRLLDRLILPTFADTPLMAITPDVVRDWHTCLGDHTPTLRAHTYSLLRSILTDAVHDGLIVANPAHIRGAGNSKRVHKIKPASLDELAALSTPCPSGTKS